MKTIECDVAVVGAGPAGLAAAEAAKTAGAAKVLVIERDVRPGGILQQCIHPGFGLQNFGEELTGPEYAERYLKRATAAGVELLTGTTALELRDGELVCAGAGGILHVRFGALVLAMGCRERTRANLVIPGSRPSGIYTAVVCRCEQITEAEIVEAIRRPVGARTLDAVKRRVRAGMGRCQSGFCGPQVLAILARELGIPETEVRKRGVAAYMLAH